MTYRMLLFLAGLLQVAREALTIAAGRPGAADVMRDANGRPW